MSVRLHLTVVAIAATVLAGCVSGRRTVGGENSYTVLSRYKAAGDGPSPLTWALVRIDDDLAMIEFDSSDPSGKIAVEKAWQDQNGHHFVLWATFLDHRSDAFEFIVPSDIEGPARRLFYPAGTYSVVKVDGVSRPVRDRSSSAPALILVPIE